MYFWGLDYWYVSYWQLHGLFHRYDANEYINSSSKKVPIILIPGIYERWQFMKPIIDVLYSRGYSVHVVDSLGYNTGSVEEMAQRVQAYIHKNKIDRYSIVAHSKGGLIAKYLVGIDSQVINKAITINTPFAGSVYAGLFPLRSIRSFLPTSAIITLLAKDITSNKKITSIYGAFDPHIPGGSFLNGATNIQLQTSGHFRIIKDPRVHTGLLRSLEDSK